MTLSLCLLNLSIIVLLNGAFSREPTLSFSCNQYSICFRFQVKLAAALSANAVSLWQKLRHIVLVRVIAVSVAADLVSDCIFKHFELYMRVGI